MHKLWCIVNLPNGTQQAVRWDPKSIGQECLEKVCRALGLTCEMEYFGLEYWAPNQTESRTHQWINLRNRLSCDNSNTHGVHLMLALRVKFWVPVHFILQQSARELFYMQARSDLLEGRLNARDWKNAAKLGALICQSDGIRFKQDVLKHNCTEKCPQYLVQLMQVQAAKEPRKDKENVLSFKKPRLSQQRSLENLEISLNKEHRNPCSALNGNCINQQTQDAQTNTNCPLSAYHEVFIQPESSINMPEDFLQQIAQEHAKLSALEMPANSAKYWLLQELQELPGYGEEIFTGILTNDNATRCDIAVGAHGITVCKGENTTSISFSAITAAKSSRRSFMLDYVDDCNERLELEIKLPKHALAAGLYRSITERHAFYICDKVRGVVTNQFTRDLKGTIASMFKEDTELGKRYVFDIQHTCREVHDRARRTLHAQGVDLQALPSQPEVRSRLGSNKTEKPCSDVVDPDQMYEALKQKAANEENIERCVEARITEAMTCKICMDRAINTLFSPCCHVIACAECAARCTKCPNCRILITGTMKIFLPPELRMQNAMHLELNKEIVDCNNNNNNDKNNNDNINCDNRIIATV